MEVYKAEPVNKKLNGYQITADGYRQYLERYPDAEDGVRENMQRTIKALDFLGQCDELTICELFNSSAFNDIVKGYIELSADSLGYTKKKKDELLYRFTSILDSQTAQEAKDYYFKN